MKRYENQTSGQQTFRLPRGFTRIILLCFVFAVFFNLVLPSAVTAYSPGSVEVLVEDYFSGEALSGVTVEMNPGGYTETTGPGGTATFSGIIPYRNYTVTTTLTGYAESIYGAGRTGYVSVETGLTTQVTIPIQKESSISGQITSGGSPLANALVLLQRDDVAMAEEGADSQIIVARTHTDGNGDYAFLNLPAAEYTIRAIADSHYESNGIVNLGVDEALTQDLSLSSGTTSLSYGFFLLGNSYSNTNIFIPMGPTQGVDYTELILSVISHPAGAEFEIGNQAMDDTTVPGTYTMSMMLIDMNGVGKETIQAHVLVNNGPIAIPTLLPGPSVLPLLYDGVVYANSAGTTAVKASDRVDIRGWAVDYNFATTEEYNPAAPMFDIYGNKNGDWGQSAFSFAWSLDNGTDVTHLLSSTSDQNVYFTVPPGTAAGTTYTATLTVTGEGGVAGTPTDISVIVATDAGNSNCSLCHTDQVTSYNTTTHSTEAVGCEDCHGPGSQHWGDTTKISSTHWPGNCGRCHDQFAEWQKSRHSDPLAFGRAEINSLLIDVCYKCHYTEGFIEAVESGEPFADYEFDSPVVPSDTPNVGCDVCHDPHDQTNPVGIRTASKASLCGTCHEQKWQNATYHAIGDVIENAWHWDDYSQYQGAGNPHERPDGCVTCHMSKAVSGDDALGVRKVGGHTMRMRDVGVDGDPGTGDDLLNISVCQGCHTSLTTFDRDGARTRIKNKLNSLGDQLKANNHDFFPPFQPGKCATCHKGGTLPFISDGEVQLLEKAFLNYKLVLNDRSLGIHNPGYIERLLDDSIEKIQDNDVDGILNGADNCPDICNSQQLDADNDTIGDVCDTEGDGPGCGGCSSEVCEEVCIPADSDGDGIPDLTDNCPDICNSQQLDADDDGIGDVCDTEGDGPGCGGCSSEVCEEVCTP